MKRLSIFFNIVYLLIMIAVVVGLDIVYFQNHPEWRFLANSGVVAVFVGGYLLAAKLKK